MLAERQLAANSTAWMLHVNRTLWAPTEPRLAGKQGLTAPIVHRDLTSTLRLLALRKSNAAEPGDKEPCLQLRILRAESRQCLRSAGKGGGEAGGSRRPLVGG